MKVIRLDDAKAGFGRRRSLAPGHSQIIGLSRKVAHLELVVARVPGTTVNASDLVSRQTKERLELRSKFANWFKLDESNHYLQELVPRQRRHHHHMNVRLWTKIRRLRLLLSFSP